MIFAPLSFLRHIEPLLGDNISKTLKFLGHNSGKKGFGLGERV
jgi:hypothetical protein